jgi:hypothetical protein
MCRGYPQSLTHDQVSKRARRRTKSISGGGPFSLICAYLTHVYSTVGGCFTTGETDWKATVGRTPSDNIPRRMDFQSVRHIRRTGSPSYEFGGGYFITWRSPLLPALFRIRSKVCKLVRNKSGRSKSLSRNGLNAFAEAAGALGSPLVPRRRGGLRKCVSNGSARS